MVLKNKFLYLAMLLLAGLCSCDEYEEDAFDFDNNFPQFVELTSTSYGAAIDTFMIDGVISANVGGDTIAVSAVGDQTINIGATLRVAQPTDTNVEVSLDGVAVEDRVTITIPAYELNASVPVTVPYGEDNLNSTTTATIVDVNNGLTIGRQMGDGSPTIDAVVATISVVSE